MTLRFRFLLLIAATSIVCAACTLSPNPDLPVLDGDSDSAGPGTGAGGMSAGGNSGDGYGGQGGGSAGSGGAPRQEAKR